MTKLNSRVRSLITVFVLLLPISAVSAAQVDGQQVLRKRLKLYQQAFPHIEFIHARGGDNWTQEYLRIATLLGEKPDALDYEHPPSSIKRFDACHNGSACQHASTQCDFGDIISS